MPRRRLLDFLQSHFFWAFDASNQGVPIFNPLFGFSKITAPQISAEVESFKDGTFLYSRNVVKGGSVGTVTFERAASMFDADFYDWIMFTLHGNKDFEDGGALGKIGNLLSQGGRVSPRRNLLIVQFSNINIGNALDIKKKFSENGPTAAYEVAAALAITIDVAFRGSLTAGALTAGAASGLFGVGVGPFEFATRVPARAWLLHNCLPIRYKAGSDFDASSANISLQELDVLPEMIEEFSLGIKP